MNIKKALTPKDVEEVRPGLFIKSFPKNPDTIEYRQVHPLVWDGKWRLKNQIKIRDIFMIALIITLYLVGVKYIRFYEEVNADPRAFCKNVSILNTGEVTHEDSSTIPINFGKNEWDLP